MWKTRGSPSILGNRKHPSSVTYFINKHIYSDYCNIQAKDLKKENSLQNLTAVQSLSLASETYEFYFVIICVWGFHLVFFLDSSNFSLFRNKFCESFLFSSEVLLFYFFFFSKDKFDTKIA
jgi:hypothetical protein